MFFRNKIVRDTALLTVMQLALDSAALLLNVFITQRLGAAAIGILSLTGSFLVLVGMFSNGNAFLCATRLVSEEIGKKNGNPNKILGYGMAFCTLLSITVGIVLFAFSDIISLRFFKSAEMVSPIRFMAVALPIGAFSSCLKGYFNASRNVGVTASADIFEFAVKAAVIAFLTLTIKSNNSGSVCSIMAGGIVAGNTASLAYLGILFIKKRKAYGTKPSISFSKYAILAFPIMFGSCLTAALSSTNDALIPVTLRQYGNSVTEALSRFGIYEAIVIPTLFFPSVVMCSLSGIVISETAKATAANDINCIKKITSGLIEKTLIFAVLTAAVLMRFGDRIGLMMDGGEFAGKMITIIAPVVPFIYLEIVLEALIKGMGLQAFSSFNYLCEYIVRISAVLILVPRIGFYGIVVSYFASNIIGNICRLMKVFHAVKPNLSIIKAFILPVLYTFLTMEFTAMIFKSFNTFMQTTAGMVIYIVIWSALYTFMICGWNNTSKSNATCNIFSKLFVKNRQNVSGNIL